MEVQEKKKGGNITAGSLLERGVNQTSPLKSFWRECKLNYLL